MKKKITAALISLLLLLCGISVTTVHTADHVQAIAYGGQKLTPYRIPKKFRGTWHTNKPLKFTVHITARHIWGTFMDNKPDGWTYKKPKKINENAKFNNKILIVSVKGNSMRMFYYPESENTNFERSGNTLIVYLDTQIFKCHKVK